MDASDVATAVESFSQVLDGHCPRGSSHDTIGVADDKLWSVLKEDGWLDAGIGEDGFPLHALAMLAVEWGRRLPPLPFSTAVLAGRWNNASIDGAMLTFALPTPEGVVVPYAVPGARSDVEPADAVEDNFDFSMTVKYGSGQSNLTPDQISELQILFVAEALGAAIENFERAAAYSQERIAYGQFISSFQAMRHHMADMHRDLELARSALFWAISTGGKDRARALRMAARLAQQTCSAAIQVYGGVGHTWELGTHRYLRHTMLVREIAELTGGEGAKGAEIQEPEETRAFRKEISEWVPQAVARARAAAGDASNPNYSDELAYAWTMELRDAGYSALAWPAEYGGADAPAAHMAIFSEECAKHHAPSDINRIGINLAGPAIMFGGTEEQKARFLPPIVQGEEVWCEGFSEPNAGSDLAAVSTTARWDGEKYLINGSKIWTSYAHKAQKIYLLTKTSDTLPRHKNLTVMLVEMNQPGVSVQPIRQITGGSEFNQVFFTDAVAYPADVLGEENEGWPLATIGAKGVRSANAGTAVWHWYIRIAGMVDRITSEQTERAVYNEAQLQGFRDRLELLWWHIARCSRMIENAELFGPAVGATQVVKLHWSQLCLDVVEVGLANAPASSRDFWRREYMSVRPVQIFGGSVQLQRNVIAEHYLKLRKR